MEGRGRATAKREVEGSGGSAPSRDLEGSGVRLHPVARGRDDRVGVKVTSCLHKSRCSNTAPGWRRRCLAGRGGCRSGGGCTAVHSPHERPAVTASRNRSSTAEGGACCLAVSLPVVAIARHHRAARGTGTSCRTSRSSGTGVHATKRLAAATRAARLWRRVADRAQAVPRRARSCQSRRTGVDLRGTCAC